MIRRIVNNSVYGSKTHTELTSEINLTEKEYVDEAQNFSITSLALYLRELYESHFLSN